MSVVDFGLGVGVAFPWSLAKERRARIIGPSTRLPCFRRESSKAAQQRKQHLFRVLSTKEDKFSFAAATSPHSPSISQHSSTTKHPMGMKKDAPSAAAAITLSSDDVVLKSPNDRRLYRLIHLQNGLRALLVHDPEIYPEGPPKAVPTDDEEEDEEEDEDEDDGDDDGEEDEYEDEEEGSEEGDGAQVEVEGKEGAKGAAAQSKKVIFL